VRCHRIIVIVWLLDTNGYLTETCKRTGANGRKKNIGTGEVVRKPAKDRVRKPAKDRVRKPAKDTVRKPAKDRVRKPARDRVRKPAKDDDPISRH
jgi:hypothetical protein